jgi:hypothetical protein
MKRTVQIYIEGQRLELFNDEQIQVNSTVQNISDISKVFTDFSQSFTVPASTVNNQIFEHFYQSDIDGTIDHNIRRSAKIEIDLTPFRSGKIQIEKSNLKNGKPESYTLTFYGDVRALKDLFGEDKLRDLDFSAYTHEYTGAQVQDRVTDGTTDYDVRYPLISSKRLWEYNGSTPSNNIDTPAGAIYYTELFPALKVKSILDVIQTTYGITFEGTFLDSGLFNKLFLWLKNKDNFNVTTLLYNMFSQDEALEYSYDSGDFGGGTHRVQLNVNTVASTEQYYIKVYKNFALYTTIVGSGDATYNIALEQNVSGLNSVWGFYIYADNPLSLSSSILYTKTIYGENGSPPPALQQVVTFTTVNGLALTLDAELNLANNMPDMKVSDFVAGLTKKFNLTCYSVETDVFTLEPLDDWYRKGAVIDITEHTDVTSIDVERLPLYKRIKFEHEQSESFLNRQFFKLFEREYGSLEQQFTYDGGEYEVKVPFENLMFNKFSGTETQVAYALNNDFQPYTPKPVLLYLYDELDTDIYFDNDTTTDNITTYVAFGQDALYNTLPYSLNFGADISSILNEPVTNSIYATYYFGYLNNLYNLKNRLVRVKTYLPISLLTSLQLNDRLIIRDKRYIINEMQSNLTTGEVNFSLILDFRPIVSNIFIDTDFKAKCLEFPIELRRGVSATLTSDDPSVTITPSSFTQSGIATICYPINPNTSFQRITEDGITRITEDGNIRRSEEGEPQIITITVTYTGLFGTTTTQIYSIQAP